MRITLWGRPSPLVVCHASPTHDGLDRRQKAIVCPTSRLAGGSACPTSMVLPARCALFHRFAFAQALEEQGALLRRERFDSGMGGPVTLRVTLRNGERGQIALHIRRIERADKA